jgi:hypothetical protein
MIRRKHPLAIEEDDLEEVEITNKRGQSRGDSDH